MTDTDFEPWTLLDLTDHLRSETPDSDRRVLREVARRICAANNEKPESCR